MEKEKTLRVLLVADKVFYLSAYRAAFEKIEKSTLDYSFEIKEMRPEEALVEYVEKQAGQDVFHIIYLHLSIPLGMNSKPDYDNLLAEGLRRHFPQATLILGTHFAQNYNIWQLIKLSEAQALVSDDSIIQTDLPEQLIQIIKDPSYACRSAFQTILKYLHRKIDLDLFDRQLLYELSKGTRMAALPKILNMSISTIEKRKKRLKERFKVEGEDDSILILKARESGAL